MYLALLIYFILGILFLFFPKDLNMKNYTLKINKLIKKDCLYNKVKCIDSCDFLCINTNFKCVNNICQSINTPSTPCNKTLGGILVLRESENNPSFWECLCTDPTFYNGKDCSTKTPDICRNGIFLYRSKGRHICKCSKPDVLVTIDDKPLCIPPHLTRFFPRGIE